MARDMMRLRREVLNNTPHEETASGAVATFKTDMAAKLKEAVISFEPQQDLHGYDAPWPRGGGINVMPPAAAETKTVNGITVVSDDNGKYTITGTATADADVRFSIPAFTIPASTDRTFCIMNSAAKGTIGFLKGYTSIDTWSMTPANRVETSYSAMANKACDGVRFIFTSGTDVNMTVSPMFLAKDKATNVFVPYSNECPITGWSQAKVQASGKNLTPYSNRGNTTRLWGTSWVNQLALIKTLRPGQYTISAKFTILTNPNNEATVQMGMLLRWKDSDGTWHQIIPYRLQTVAATVGAVYDYSKTFALTDADLAANLGFYLYCGTDTTATTANCYDCQIELGSTATAYKPYQGNTYTIDLNGTRYGGTLNVLSGVLTVDRAEVDLGTLSWGNWNSVNGWIAKISPAIKQMASNIDPMNAIASDLKVVSKVESLAIVSAGTNEDTISSAWTGVYVYGTNANRKPTGQLVYELATPFTVQLTPTQLRAIKGKNNIFSDCGDVAVKYWKHGG